jgi:rubrerythrin
MYQLAESGSVSFLETLRDRAAAEGDTWLAEKLDHHAGDERRHGQIFANALKQMNKQVIDSKNLPKPAERPKSDQERRSPFFAAFFEGYSPENLKPDKIEWTVFLGSTYILELDASKDFARAANALPDDDPVCRNIKKGILSVAQDETRHAAYLYEAMGRRMPAAAVDTLVNEWRTRKVNALLAMVTNLIQKGDQTRSLVRDGVPTELSDNANDATPEQVAA